jgi:hypothetical protein
MAKYTNDGKVVEVKGTRFNVNYLKTNRKTKVFKELYSVDKDILEQAFNEVNNIKPKKEEKTSPKKSKSDKKPDKNG